MDHQDHVGLLRDGITSLGGIWAEFGSGGGAFTLALAELIGPEGEIFSIDYDRAALINQSRKFTRERYPHLPEIHYLYKDYRQPISLPPLNGLLMANSLHFQEDKVPVLRLIYNYLLPGGSLILVEYNSDQDNPWVPYPISYGSWRSLAEDAGFQNTRLLGRISSSFMGEIFSAISDKKTDQR